MTMEGVLRSFSSVKDHRTRVEHEINSLLELLHAQYSATSGLRLNDRLEKLERHMHKLLDISEYLVIKKYPRAQRLINLEIPVLVRSLKSSNVELG